MKKTKILLLSASLIMLVALAFQQNPTFENTSDLDAIENYEIIATNGPGRFNTCHRSPNEPLESPVILVHAPSTLQQFSTVCYDDTMIFSARSPTAGIDLPGGFRHYQWEISANVHFVNGTNAFSRVIEIEFSDSSADGFSVILSSVWCDGRTTSTVRGGTVTGCGADPDI